MKNLPFLFTLLIVTIQEQINAQEFECVLPDTSIIDISQADASFPGGEDSLATFIRKNLKFTPEMKELAIIGTVYVQFIVEKDGSLTNFMVIRGIHPTYDFEALRVLRLMPNWIPGLDENNQPERITYIVPINFTTP